MTTIFTSESGQNFDISGWEGGITCGCDSCTNPGKEPTQWIMSPEGKFFEWGDGISRDDNGANDFICARFGCDSETANEIISLIEGEPIHITW